VTRLPFVLATLAVAGSSVAHAQRAVSLVGQWTSEAYVSGETGVVTLNFFSNGTYSRKSLLVTEFGWTLAGSTLLIAPVLEKKDQDIKYGKASEIELVFNGDTLWASSGDQRLTLTRVTGPVEEGMLLGRWQSISDENETIVQDFRADGKLLVTATQSREAGRYSIYDESINLQTQIPIPSRKKWRFKLAGTKLLLYMNQKLPPLELSKTDDQIVTRSY
jgi:hypothetical protein